MNSGLPESPALKTPEPLAVSFLDSFLKQADLGLGESSVFWIRSDSGVQRYRVSDVSDKNTEVRVISFLSEDEKIIFRAFQDWFASAIRKVSDVSRGYFTFNVLQFEIGDAPWSWNDFSILLITHAKKMAVGGRQLIQFGALWGILEKHTEADFGRVDSKLKIDFYKNNPESLARWVKKILSKEASAEGCFVLRDESRNSIIQGDADFELFRSLVRPNVNDRKDRRVFFWHPLSKRCLPI